MTLNIDAPDTERLPHDLAVIRQRCAELPVLDEREPDDIVGYDQDGLLR